MQTIPDSRRQKITTFHPAKAKTREEKAAAGKAAALQIEVKDRLETAMGRDQIELEECKDKAPNTGEVEIDQEVGCHLVETDLHQREQDYLVADSERSHIYPVTKSRRVVSRLTPTRVVEWLAVSGYEQVVLNVHDVGVALDNVD